MELIRAAYAKQMSLDAVHDYMEEIMALITAATKKGLMYVMIYRQLPECTLLKLMELGYTLPPQMEPNNGIFHIIRWD